MKVVLVKKAILSTVFSVCFFSGCVNAALIDRGNGMIYDDVMNVTWLQDANLGGRLNWHDANNWAENLEYGGYSDWRLPTVYDQGNDGCNYSTKGTDCGFNVNPSVTDEGGQIHYSELAYMLYNNLNNGAETFVVNTDFTDAQTGAQLSFDNLFFTPDTDNRFWTGTSYPQDSNYSAWFFDTGIGFQGASEDNLYQTWALRDGDVNAVEASEPATAGIFALAIAGFMYRMRRRRL